MILISTNIICVQIAKYYWSDGYRYRLLPSTGAAKEPRRQITIIDGKYVSHPLALCAHHLYTHYHIVGQTITSLQTLISVEKMRLSRFWVNLHKNLMQRVYALYQRENQLS